MFTTILRKELMNLYSSPRFVVLFVVCSVLILLSFYVGVNEYSVSVRQYESARQLAEQQLQELSSWASFQTQAFRRPDPMQIFVTGVGNDVGRLTSVNNRQPINLRRSLYSDDPLFAMFRHFDFTLIIQVILALFALLVTYDAVNGEREAGTLKLALSSAVPRTTYIAAKFAGSWLGLLLPLSLPLLLGLLIMQVLGVHLTGDHWSVLLTILGFSVLYLTFFIAFGLMVSALTRRATVSFLISLVCWVAFVLILPRVCLMVATQLSPVPSVAEVEGQRDTFAKERWERHIDAMGDSLDKRENAMAGMTPEEREAYRDENMWEWFQQDDARRRETEADIENFGNRLREELRNKTMNQERLSLSLVRISPAALYQMAVMNLAGTGVGLKHEYEEALSRYRSSVTNYAQAKADETGDSAGLQISISSETGIQIQRPRDRGGIDTSGLPRFSPPETSLRQALTDSVLEGGLLILFTLAAYAVAFVAFLRYDPR